MPKVQICKIGGIKIIVCCKCGAYTVMDKSGKQVCWWCKKELENV